MMPASAAYGVLLVSLYFFCRYLVPEPYGMGVFFALVSFQLASGSFLVWRRMRLRYVAASMMLGAVGALVAAALAFAGYTLQTAPLPWLVFLGIAAILSTIALPVEARVSPEVWQAWADHMRESNLNLADMIVCNHIPDLESAKATRRAGGSG